MLASETLSLFLTDFGYPCTFNRRGETIAQTIGILDINGSPISLGDIGAEGREIMLLCETAKISEVRNRDTVSIRGKDYLVISADPIDDGAFSKLQLKEVQ